MAGRANTDELVALEQARAQLEGALSGNAHWRALCGMGDNPGRDLHEAALAGNPLYKSWKLLDEAVASLRSAESGAEQTAVEQKPDVEIAEAAPDDLTRIRGISLAQARQLAGLGVDSYRDIAAWRTDDVRRVSEALGLNREISRQNWIEQAALLDRRVHGVRNDATAPAPVAEPIPVAAEEPVPDPPSVDSADEVAAAAVEPTAAVVEEPHPRDREIDLPDIIEHIRNGSAPVSLFEAFAEPDAAEPEEVHEEPIVDVAPAPAASEDQSVPTPLAAAQPRPSIPTVAASSHMNTDAAERARRLEEERRRLAAKGLVEPDEATVTFVIREPVRAAAHAAGAPTPEPVAKGDGRGQPYVPAKSQTEEAEVEIVRPDTPAGAVRRFLRTLTGG